ncbi:MAG: RHS repeat-associated core domain-containing protein [Bacteroidales bacterium]|nr:RHS repeat-associated core domain-containing protein [Bacteroidales bacterium]
MITAKELDNETSYTYFGARYYDSKLSGWMSVDPMSDERRWVSPYAYCQWNPLIRIDLTGLFDIKTSIIEKGDNLSKITKRINEKFGLKLTISDISKANNIEDVNKIKVGDKIALPGQNVELNFDLKSLKVTDATYGIDMPELSWEATSIREGYQSSEFQNVAGEGPILEVSYMLGQTQSYIPVTSFPEKALELVGFTNWEGTWTKGRTNASGTQRTWLTPMQGTNTYRRSDFSIHRGTTPGYAGCFDLTKNNNFHSWLTSYGKSVKLNVKY